MPKKGTCTAQPRKLADGKWRIQITLTNGKRPARKFDTKAEASDWKNAELDKQNKAHAPVLGGPDEATLAQALDHYARIFSVTKKGVDQELIRINHYLEGAGMPLLGTSVADNGGVSVVEVPAKTLSKEFQAHVEQRREASAGTFAFKHKLARMLCSEISHADIAAFKAQMLNDGLSDSTIQKEIALLKVFFNTTKLMNWKGLENPCVGVKLGKSARRFVHLSTEQRNALWAALAECDNPYFFPLVLTAKESTMRLDTLMRMTWANTSVEDRHAYLPTKTGNRPFVLSLDVQKILAGLPRDGKSRVFPMSKSAVDSIWERVRIKAGLPKLQFRDLRHLGATDWVRRGLTAHELKQVLGHDGIATAQFYIDLVGKDIESALDRASDKAGVAVLPQDFPKDPQGHINQRRGERLNKGRAKTEAAQTVAVNEAAQGAVAPQVDQTPATVEPEVAVQAASPAPSLQTVQPSEEAVPAQPSARVVYVNFGRKAA